MKYLTIFAVLTIAQLGHAQSCEPSSKEMGQYLAQKNWKPLAVTDPSGSPEIDGYVDEQNRFYFESLNRSGDFPVSITVDTDNKDYKDFFKYCRNSDRQGSYLRSMRQSRSGNKYSATVRYLPEMTGFANQPLIDLNYQESKVDLILKYDGNSILTKNESYWDKSKAEIYQSLQKQILGQKELGVLKLDLTGLDDLVCDLVQGHAKISVERSALSNAPLVQQKKVVDTGDLQATYLALKDQLLPSFNKEKALFTAGRVSAKLELDRKIAILGDKKSFELLQKLMTPDMSKLSDLDGAALTCVADQMQEYTRSLMHQEMEVRLKFPSLDAIDPAQRPKL